MGNLFCNPSLSNMATLQQPQSSALAEHFLSSGVGSACQRSSSGLLKEKSSIMQSTVNLVKNIVGAGMLSLPSGVAAYTASPQGIFPALFFTGLLGLVSAYTFMLIADVCSRTGETSYQGAWAKSVSPGTRWLLAIACGAVTGTGCISFSMILGDCLSLLLEPFGLPAYVSGRSATMLAITTIVIFPLCCMDSLAPLAKFSVLGVLSNIYICFFILRRAFDGSYEPASDSPLLTDAPHQPHFARSHHSMWQMVVDPSFCVLLGILSTSFIAHYNAPSFYEQLDPGPHDNRAVRFCIVSLLGFGAAVIVFSVVMAGGFMTFGSNSSGLILDNYAPSDHLASFGRFALVLSVTTAYPLVFLSVREVTLDFMGADVVQFAEQSPALLTLFILIIITGVALWLTDLGKLVSFAGAAFGSFIIYVAPALMALGAQRKKLGSSVLKLDGAWHSVLQLVMIVLGIVLGMIGALQSLAD